MQSCNTLAGFFWSVRFHVKPILGMLKVKNLPFQPSKIEQIHKDRNDKTAVLEILQSQKLISHKSLIDKKYRHGQPNWEF